MDINILCGNDRFFTIDDRIKVGQDEYVVDPDRWVGSGGNAVVYACEQVVTGDSYAIKFQVNISENRESRFIREIQVLKSLSHGQLIKYIAHGKIPIYYPKNHSNIDDGVRSFLIMPLAERNLKQSMKRRKNRLLFEEYIGQFKGLAEALSVLHTRAIHRDIKPENILVSGETWILSDLGLCKFNVPQCEDITLDTEPVGPRYWMSPEATNRIIGNRDVITKSSDVFQLASVFWYVVTGRHPTGIITEHDWRGPNSLFMVLADALSHDMCRRPQDGTAFYERLNATAFS